MQHMSPVALVQAWQDAANNQDVDRLIAMSAATIEVVGPRGSGRGHQLLREWLARAGLHLTTRRAFARDDVVVLAQHAVWRSAPAGDVTGEQDLASRYRVDDPRSPRYIVQVARHDTLGAALAAAGLGDVDETAVPAPRVLP